MSSLQAYQQVMSKYHDDDLSEDSGHSDTYNEETEILTNEQSPTAEGVRNKNRANPCTGRNIREELKANKYKALEELFRDKGANGSSNSASTSGTVSGPPLAPPPPPPPPPPPTSLSNIKYSDLQRAPVRRKKAPQRDTSDTVQSSPFAPPLSPPPLPQPSTSLSNFQHSDLQTGVGRPKRAIQESKQTRSEKSHFQTGMSDFDKKMIYYREQFKAECWNVRQVIKQFQYLFDEFENLSDSHSWQLEDFLEMSQRLCVAKERRDVFNQKIQDVVQTFLCNGNDGFENFNMPNMDFGSMRVDYDFRSVTLSVSDFEPGFLFAIFICQDQVLVSRVISIEQSDFGFVRLDFNQTFKNVSSSFRACLKLYSRSNRPVKRRHRETKNQQSIVKSKAPKLSLFRRIFSGKKVRQDEDDAGDENICQGEITIDWKERIVDESEEKENPSGFKLAGQTVINCVNWAKRDYRLDARNNQYLVERSVHVVHYANVNTIQI